MLFRYEIKKSDGVTLLSGENRLVIMTPVLVDQHQFNLTRNCNAQQLTGVNAVMGMPCMTSRTKIDHRLHSAASHDVNDDNDNIEIIPLDVATCNNGIYRHFLIL